MPPAAPTRDVPLSVSSLFTSLDCHLTLDGQVVTFPRPFPLHFCQFAKRKRRSWTCPDVFLSLQSRFWSGNFHLRVASACLFFLRSSRQEARLFALPGVHFVTCVPRSLFCIVFVCSLCRIFATFPSILALVAFTNVRVPQSCLRCVLLLTSRRYAPVNPTLRPGSALVARRAPSLQLGCALEF